MAHFMGDIGKCMAVSNIPTGKRQCTAFNNCKLTVSFHFSGPFPKGMQNMWAQVEQSPSDLLKILQQSAMTIGGGSSAGGNDFQMDHDDLQQQLRSQGVTLISE